MRKTAILTAAVLLMATSVSEAGLFRCRSRAVAKVVVRGYCAGAQCGAIPVQYPAVQYAPVAVPAPTPQAVPQAAVQGGSDAAYFLAALNSWRAANGRGPLAWDATLASFAASNSGVHDPASSGGGSQTWAGVSSLTAALPMWLSSPPHAAILLSGTVIGASPCPSGCSANVR